MAPSLERQRPPTVASCQLKADDRVGRLRFGRLRYRACGVERPPLPSADFGGSRFDLVAERGSVRFNTRMMTLGAQ